MRRILRTVLGYLAATYLTLVLCLAVYGVAVPRPGDRAALAARGLHGTPVLVGMRSVMRETPQGLQVDDACYYLVPADSLRHARLWRVDRPEAGPLHVEASATAFWGVLSAFLASALATWRYWFRRRAPRERTAAEPLRAR
ncbi:hypothetical protein [Lysobacter humi (ex Lee et al. 2017)]